MGRSDLHGDLVDHVLTQTQLVLGMNVHVQKQISGLFTNPSGFPMRANFPGIADIGGYARGGKAFQVECKTGDAKQNPDQVCWEARCTFLGVEYMLCHAAGPEQVDAAVKHVIHKVSTMVTGMPHVEWGRYKAFKARRASGNNTITPPEGTRARRGARANPA